MNRRDHLLKYIDKSEKGIEVAPYFNPLISKRDGYDVMILDVFDTERLREHAKNDPNIPNDRLEEIEEVDIVCDASSIGEQLEKRGLLGQAHYIVSSHNFEHLPNPILFLQGAEKALSAGGVLSMAVPDYRACFDHFRMPTRLVDWLSAFHRNISQPSPETMFDSLSNIAPYYRSEVAQAGCSLGMDDPAGFKPVERLEEAYANYVQNLTDPGEYRDVHCSVFVPQTLELMFSELRFLGLIGLEVVEVSKTSGHEFFVHLRRPVTPTPMDKTAFYARRRVLLGEISNVLGATPYQRNFGNKIQTIMGPARFKQGMQDLLGRRIYRSLRSLNRKRLDAQRLKKQSKG